MSGNSVRSYAPEVNAVITTSMQSPVSQKDYEATRFIVAQEVGLEQLWHEGQAAIEGTFETKAQERIPSGIELLTEAMRGHVFPLTTHEARELFRQ